MPSVHAIKRVTKQGEPRWHVRYQHDSYHSPVHLAVARTQKDRDKLIERARSLVADGVQPTRELLAPKPASERRTVASVTAEWLAGRVDVADSSRDAYTVRARHVTAGMGRFDIQRVAFGDVQAWVASMRGALGASTIRLVVSTLGQVFDYAGVRDNPARDKRLRLPRVERREPRMPTRDQFEAMIERLPTRRQAVARLILVTGVRVEEACELDAAGRRPGRLLCRGTKTHSALRWLEDLGEGPFAYPDDVLELVSRPGRFVGEHDPNRLTGAFIYASGGAISPHDLRHLHGTVLWHDGWKPAAIAERLGHRDGTFSLRKYAHVALPDGWLEK